MIAAEASARAHGWRPLLHGTEAARAWEAIESIAGGLARRDEPSWGPSLAGGHAGLALFHAYRARATGGDSREADRHLEIAARALATCEMDASLFEGLTGIAWAVEHLRGAREDLNESVDEVLADLLSSPSDNDEYDLASGVVGFGVYALERHPRPSAVECLRLIVECLRVQAERQPEGWTWRAPRHLLPAEHQITGAAYRNLGVAHGVLGPIAFLAQVSRTAAGSEAGLLMDGAVSWLRAQRLPSSELDAFPCLIGSFDPLGRPNRNGWCHGDPGLAGAWACAALTGGRADWGAEALEVALRVARRPPQTLRVSDAGICHGAAGLAHIFNRLYQATGSDALRAAAEEWITRVLDLRQPDRPFGGFPALGLDASGAPQWQPDPGLIAGAAGVGLVLLAAVTDIEPAWDRVLLLSAHA